MAGWSRAKGSGQSKSYWSATLTKQVKKETATHGHIYNLISGGKLYIVTVISNFCLGTSGFEIDAV